MNTKCLFYGNSAVNHTFESKLQTKWQGSEVVFRYMLKFIAQQELFNLPFCMVML